MTLRRLLLWLFTPIVAPEEPPMFGPDPIDAARVLESIYYLGTEPITTVGLAQRLRLESARSLSSPLSSLVGAGYLKRIDGGYVVTPDGTKRVLAEAAKRKGVTL